MNKTYKVIWSKAKNCYVVVSELAKNHTKGCSTKRLLAMLIATGVMSVGMANVASADNTITLNGNTITVATGEGDSATSTDYALGGSNMLIGSADQIWGTGAVSVGSIGAVAGNAVNVGHSNYVWNANGVTVGNGNQAGSNSVSIGINNTANGANAAAVGTGITASGANAAAIGAGSAAKESSATAVGTGSNAEGNSSTSVGAGANTTAGSATAVGAGSGAIGSAATAVGTGANAEGITSVAAGAGAKAIGESAIAVGTRSNAEGKESAAIGVAANATGRQSVALGISSNAAGAQSVAIGLIAKANNTNAVAVGFNTNVYGDNGVAVGSGVGAAASATAVGTGANAWGEKGVAVGAAGAGTQAAAVGDGANASGNQAAALGNGANASASMSAAIGNGSNSWGEKGVAIGAAGAGTEATAVGNKSNAWGEKGVAIGGANAGNIATAIGSNANGFGDGGVVSIGRDSSVGGNSGVAVGRSASVNGNEGKSANGTAVGTTSKVFDDFGTAVGTGATAGKYGVAIGAGNVYDSYNGLNSSYGPNANGEKSVSVGYNANSSNLRSIAIGSDSNTHGIDATAIGTKANASGEKAIAIGANYKDDEDEYRAGANANATNSIGIGTSANANKDNTVAIGTLSNANDENAVALGNRANASGENSVAIGGRSGRHTSIASGDNSVSIGTGVASGADAVSIGISSKATGAQSVSIGTGGDANGDASVAIGASAPTYYDNGNLKTSTSSTKAKSYAVSIGSDTNADPYAVALGFGSNASVTKAVAIGGASSNAEKAVAIGSGTHAHGDNAVGIGSKGTFYHTSAYRNQDKKSLNISTSDTLTSFTTDANGKNSVAIGLSYAGNENDIAIGTGTLVSGWKSSAIGIGNDNNVTGPNAISIGNYNQVTHLHSGTEFSLAIGVGNNVNSGDNIAIGFGAYTTEYSKSLSIGYMTEVSAARSVGIGAYARAYVADAVSVGYNALANANKAVSIGSDSWSVADSGVALGNSAHANHVNSVAIGYGALGNNVEGVAIGTAAEANRVASVSIGKDSKANQDSSVALGEGSYANIDKGQYGYDPKTGTLSTTDNGVWKATHAGVSVGRAAEPENGITEITRQINNVAAGTQLTDAVNVAQLQRAMMDSETGKGNIHFYSVGQYDPAETDNNYNNDGAGEYRNALAAGISAKVTGDNGTAVGNHVTAGNNAVAVGSGASAAGDNSVAIGNGAVATLAGGVALGAGSEASYAVPTENGYDVKTKEAHKLGKDEVASTWKATAAAVSVGKDAEKDADGNITKEAITRQIKNVAAGSDDTDAVNVAQLKQAIGSIEVTTIVNENHTTESTTNINVDGSDLPIITLDDTKEQTIITIGDVKGDYKKAEIDKVTAKVDGDTMTVKVGKNNEQKLTVTKVTNEDGYLTVTDKGTDGAHQYVVGIDTTKVATKEDGLKYAGDFGDGAAVKLNNTVNVVGNAENEADLTDGNIGVVAAQDGDNGKLTVKLNKDIDLGGDGSITIGDTNITNNNIKMGDTNITNNNITTNEINVGDTVTINEGGIDMGDTKITNVKAGTEDGDAVNYGQLKQTQNQVDNNTRSINRLSSRVDKVGAGAAALAALHPLDFDPDDKLTFSAGVGNYRGENAAAIGMFYRPDEKVLFSLGGTVGNDENMVNAGVSFSLDRTARVTNTKTAMAKEIIDLRAKVVELTATVEKMGTRLGTIDEDKITLFPDIDENHWAYEYVGKLAAAGIIEGYPDGNFGGDRMMSRYEFAAMLYRAMQNGAQLDGKIIKEFAPEMGRIRVDRISGGDNDKHKVERVRTNGDEKDAAGNVTQYRDHYGSKITPASK